MTTLTLIRNTAATVTLIAGILACAVRFGPHVAPEQHATVMYTLAAVLGADLGPVPAPPPAEQLALATFVAGNQ